MRSDESFASAAEPTWKPSHKRCPEAKAEHVFKDATANVTDTTVGKSWKILGQGVLTSLIDMILFSLMWNIFPLRFLILLISSPFRLLNERSNRQKIAEPWPEEQTALNPPTTATNEILPNPAASITEQTTGLLKTAVVKDYREDS
jgi:hypothetical protein